jgi:hypothetical protein
MRKLLLGCLILASLAWLTPTKVFAQTSSSVVVANCGTPPTTYVAGYPYPNTQDTTGTLCTKGGSGTVTVQGNQSNAGAGTTGGNNVPTNSYTYIWNGSAWVQAGSSNPFPTTPSAVTTTPTGFTITTANTFQSILAANAGRKGCTVQNKNPVGGDSESFFFGPNASATVAASLSVAPGGAFTCATGAGGILTDNISVTSIASGTDTGVVNAQ